jgi:hypothetical protein
MSAQANSSGDPFLKNPSQKRSSGVAQAVGSEFKPQYYTHTKKTLLSSAKSRLTIESVS